MKSRLVVPRRRRSSALALVTVLGWLCASPSQALGQLSTGSVIVTIESPSAGSTVSGLTPVTARVSLIGSITVVGVQFRLDGVNLGAEDTASPYSITWNTVTAANGPHTLTAVARDVLGLQHASEPVRVTVFNDKTPPSVALTSPEPGSAVTGTIAVTASASDNVGVVGVQFRLDGNPLGAEDTSEPYSVTWDTTTATNVSHTLTAVARDAAGNRATSVPVSVTVANDRPTVRITSPESGSIVAGTITISATASDDVGVVGVEFRLDGNPGVEDTTEPFAITWNTTTVSNGPYTLTAIARDTDGNRTTSAPVTVTVANDSTVAQCASPLAPFPGRTDFNNSIRAQMWIADNTWGGAFSDASSGIYFYQLAGGAFAKGALIDPNFTAGRPDTLWNGRELFVLVYQSGSLARLYKYSYASGSYSLVPGFPVGLPLAGAPPGASGIALHQDSTGKLWATYASGTNVHVIWSTSADHLTWDTTGVILASDVASTTTEAATIAHFGGDRIGVVWSNQALGEIAFRFHRDGDPETAWSPREIVDCCQGIPGAADDHLSLRAAPDGRLFLVAKNDIGPGQLHLYIRSVDGLWGQKTLVDPDPRAQPTRPTLVLDAQNGNAYVIYHNSTDNLVYFTRTSLDRAAFALRCAFVNQGNNVTSTKQNVDGTTELVAAASRAGQIIGGVIDLE